MGRPPPAKDFTLAVPAPKRHYSCTNVKLIGTKCVYQREVTEMWGLRTLHTVPIILIGGDRAIAQS